MRHPAPRYAQVLVAGLAVLGVTTGLAGCGSSGAGTKALAGHTTPAGAAAGFLLAASANEANQACSYVAPSQTSICSQALTRGSPISVKGLRLGDTTVSGSHALVTALGMLCTDSGSKVCFTSKDRSGGQPTRDQTFAQAYSEVESGSSSLNDPAIPCTEVGGRWYVDLGQSSASSGATTTTVPG